MNSWRILMPAIGKKRPSRIALARNATSLGRTAEMCSCSTFAGDASVEKRYPSCAVLSKYHAARLGSFVSVSMAFSKRGYSNPGPSTDVMSAFS